MKLPALKNMMNFIRSRSGERMGLPEIAAAGSVCESSSRRLFRKYPNRTPIEYLTEYRLLKACALLRATQMTVTEAAFLSGFSGATYFEEQFRKRYYRSPTEYRRREG